MTQEQGITGMGFAVEKLEEQVRALTEDLQRLGHGLDSEGPLLTASASPIDNSQFQVTSIKAESAIEGLYVSNGNLQVDGLVKGELLCRGRLVITDNGLVRGVVEASDIVLAGRLEGEVHCEGSFVILPTGWFSGKLRAATTVIHEGAFYSGTLELRNERSKELSPRATALLDLLEQRKSARLSLDDLSYSFEPPAGNQPTTGVISNQTVSSASKNERSAEVESVSLDEVGRKDSRPAEEVEEHDISLGQGSEDDKQKQESPIPWLARR